MEKEIMYTVINLMQEGGLLPELQSIYLRNKIQQSRTNAMLFVPDNIEDIFEIILPEKEKDTYIAYAEIIWKTSFIISKEKEEELKSYIKEQIEVLLSIDKSYKGTLKEASYVFKNKLKDEQRSKTQV